MTLSEIGCIHYIVKLYVILQEAAMAKLAASEAATSVAHQVGYKLIHINVWCKIKTKGNWETLEILIL